MNEQKEVIIDLIYVLKNLMMFTDENYAKALGPEKVREMRVEAMKALEQAHQIIDQDYLNNIERGAQ